MDELNNQELNNEYGSVSDQPEQPAAEPEKPEAGDGSIVAEEVESENSSGKTYKVSNGVKNVFDYVETFCFSLAVVLFVFLFLFRYTSVDGDSMLPTLHGGHSSEHTDRLIISNLFYTPKTGDIVVFNTETEDKILIKRVIAVGGQTVRIDFQKWEVSVDGVVLDEPYIYRRENVPMSSGNMKAMYGTDEHGVCTFTVSEGKVFVMGDNRNNSKDSRFLDVGEQDVDHILGRVIFRLDPFNEFGAVKSDG